MKQLSQDLLDAVGQNDPVAIEQMSTRAREFRLQVDGLRQRDPANSLLSRLDAALFVAASKGGTKRLKALLAAGADPNMVDSISGFTPLRMAVIRQFERCVQVLIEAGADIEGRDSAGETPLFSAAAANLADLVKQLLAAGADPDARNGAELAPLDVSFDPTVQGLLENAIISKGKKSERAA